MAKSILVVDAPKNCRSCTVRKECRRQTRKNNDAEATIPVWCPLIPEPFKMPLDKADSKEQQLIWHGWNLCVGAFWCEDDDDQTRDHTERE